MSFKTLGVSLAGTLLLGLFALTPVQASGYRHGHGTHDGYGHGKYGYGHRDHRYGGSHGYRGKRRAHLRPHGRHGHGRAYSHSYGYRSDHRGYKGHAYPKACHPVSKIGYWYGDKARIGGTLCYDAYGRSYILSGSRYLIDYVGY